MNIKRIMALLLALVMVLSLVAMGFQVFAAEDATTPDVDVETGEDDDLVVDFGDLVNALGTEKNPINVENATDLTSVKVNANSETYYAISAQLNDMVLTIVGNENTTVTLNGTELEADEDGLFQATLTGTPVNKLVVANAGAEAVELVAAIEYPLGSENNPIVVNTVEDMVSPTVGAGQSVYILINAQLNGKLLNVAAEEGITVVVNRVAAENVDGTYTTELTGIPTNRVVITNAGEAEMTVYASITEKPGAESNPIWLNIGENTVTIAAGETVYYQGRFGGMTMTVGAGLTVTYNGTTYAAGETFTFAQGGFFAPPAVIAVSAEADTTSTLIVAYPIGSMENPAALVMGKNEATLDAGSMGYYYTWTAAEDGTLVITGTANTQFTVNNMTTYVYGDRQVGAVTYEVEVAAGDVIEVSMNTFDAADEYALPAGTATITAAFEPAIVKFNLTGASMTLGNELAMNFFIGKAYYAEGVYAEITKTAADGTTETITTTFTKYNTAGSLYVTKFDGLAAKEMCDEITVIVYNAEGKQISNPWTDSVKAYAMRMLPKTSKAAEQTVFVEMLNYGAAAQIQFKYGTDNLANADLSDEQKAFGIASVEVQDERVKGTGYIGSNLSLENRILLNVFFNGNIVNNNTHAVITFTSYNGTTVNEIPVAASEYGKQGTYTIITIDDIVLADSFSLVTVTVYNADGTVVAYASDSVESYAARMSTGDDIFMAIAKFAQAAYNYLKK